MQINRNYSKQKKCLTKGCDRDRSARGLCPSCYYQARGVLSKGKITEKELIERGLILAPNTKKSLFRAQLD